MSVLDSLIVAIVGIVVVFLGLTILIFCINITSLFFKNKSNNKNKIVNTNIEENSEANKIQVYDDKLDEQIIAAITSAIYAYIGDNQNNKSFIVRKIKRVSNY